MEKQTESTYRLTIRAPKHIGEWINKRADERGISNNAHIITTLEAQMQSETLESEGIEAIRAEANAIQAHADALEAEGMSE